ncbi:hypothetical protein BDV19DRAFT_310967 [Aspergillus venezuelensis]
MVAAFGFSAGDFIAAANLIWNISQALSDASEDSKLFRGIQLELFALHNVIVQFRDTVTNRNNATVS